MSSAAPAASNAVRNRDVVLLIASLVGGLLAVWYRGAGFELGLVLLSAALFWTAVLDSALHGANPSPLLAKLAGAVLVGIGIVVLAVVVLVFLRPAKPVAPVAPAAAPRVVPLPPPTSRQSLNYAVENSSRGPRHAGV